MLNDNDINSFFSAVDSLKNTDVQKLQTIKVIV